MFLQRHGESETNQTKTFTCRRLDPGLTETGRRQIEALVPYYTPHSIELIVSSPSKRAVESARILCAGLGAGHEIHECLLEVDVGDLEGESEQDQALLEDFFSVIEDWLIHKKNSRFPGGESWREVEERLKVLESMLFARPAVFVGHGALFMIFLGTRGVHFKKVEDLFLPRAGIARYLQPEQAWRIEKNCVAPAAAGPL